jgi:uncharacterized membrane protein
MRLISHHKHAVNVAKAERWVSGIGGGLLTIAGVRKQSPGGIAMAVGGGLLMRRAITGHCEFYEALGVRSAPKGQGAETTSVPYELGIRVDKAITIDKPRDEMYRFWRDISNLSRFMKNVESIHDLGENRSHWVVSGPAGRMLEWDAVIHNEVENELIGWRSLPGAHVDHAGSVQFKDAPGGRGTEVKVELQYNPPAGPMGALVSMLWGKEPGLQIGEDLRRLKQMLEAGEIPTTEGQPSGASRRMPLCGAVRKREWSTRPRRRSRRATRRRTPRNAGLRPQSSGDALRTDPVTRRNT